MMTRRAPEESAGVTIFSVFMSASVSSAVCPLMATPTPLWKPLPRMVIAVPPARWPDGRRNRGNAKRHARKLNDR